MIRDDRLAQAAGLQRRRAKLEPVDDVDGQGDESSEVDVIIEYFQSATPEHLEMLGVDPTRLPPPESWRERMRQECALPIDQKSPPSGGLVVG